jgi:hypothetical protein
MAIYASFHARGTQRVDVVTLGAISAPQPCLAPGQMHTASSAGTAPGLCHPKAVQASAPTRHRRAPA